MLFDLLGVVIAFITVILLFSIVVTTLVELSERLLNMRHKNLHFGIDIFIQRLSLDKQLVENAITRLTYGVLNESGDKQKAPFILKEIDWQSLKTEIEYLAPESSETRKQLATIDFDREIDVINSIMQRRFKARMSTASLVVSLLVALSFQLNGFELLKQINDDALLRQSLLSVSEQMVDTNTPTALAAFNELQHQSQMFNLSVKFDQQALQYYFLGADVVAHWVGVLLTALLLSLGAPYWFDVLKRLTLLRHSIQPKR